MAAAAPESLPSDGGRDGRSRGSTRRPVGLAKDAKIRELTCLVGELAKSVQASVGRGGDADTLADRLICLTPRAEAAMQGEHGHVRETGQRVRGNLATHAGMQYAIRAAILGDANRAFANAGAGVPWREAWLSLRTGSGRGHQLVCARAQRVAAFARALCAAVQRMGISRLFFWSLFEWKSNETPAVELLPRATTTRNWG